MAVQTQSSAVSETIPTPDPSSVSQHSLSGATPRSSLSERPIDAPVGRPLPVQRASTSNYTTKNQRSSTVFSFAAAALDKTQTAFANISEPVIRPRLSNSTLYRHSLNAGSTPNSEASSPLLNTPKSPLSSLANAQDPPSQPYTSTDPHQPAPIKVRHGDKKMHQTSSRLLRMTEDDRPFTKDFKDLFSTLIVSLLPLQSHRVRLTKIDYTFLSEDAISNLGSLKFSQSNRMPDPKDPSRVVTTTTTTTFSMAKDMARSICQRFVEARFIESADGKYQQVYNMKGMVWQLTPKGVTVLDRFCMRNGIVQKQVAELVARNAAHLVIVERDQQSDKLLHDQATVEVIFRRFAGTEGRNVKPTVSAADSDSLHEYRDGMTGVKMAAERKINGKTFRDTFTGKATVDWLMDCSTIVDRRETIEIATLFVQHDLIEPVAQDRPFVTQNPTAGLFQPTKNAVYQITQNGKEVINGTNVRGRNSESENDTTMSPRVGAAPRDSNTQRLDRILTDPALRLLFRENLRETHCEENLSFYQDVVEFVRSCKAAIRIVQKNPTTTSMDGIKEIMAQAYGIYNAFLAPGSPCELNIDHQLRNNLATRMTKAVGQDVAMIDTLQEVTELFEDAQNAVFKLMASDSVPKFLRSPKYEQQLRHYELENVGRVVERSKSRSSPKV